MFRGLLLHKVAHDIKLSNLSCSSGRINLLWNDYFVFVMEQLQNKLSFQEFSIAKALDTLGEILNARILPVKSLATTRLWLHWALLLFVKTNSLCVTAL